MPRTGSVDGASAGKSASAASGWAYEKFTRRANDWAIVGVAVVDGRVGLVNMGSTPLRAAATEAALAEGASIADAAALADQGTEPARRPRGHPRLPPPPCPRPHPPRPDDRRRLTPQADPARSRRRRPSGAAKGSTHPAGLGAGCHAAMANLPWAER